ncbi:unnamed protein product, partial [Amoebophrya sp. A120]|eukprot:GSA120T00021927001.1
MKLQDHTSTATFVCKSHQIFNTKMKFFLSIAKAYFIVWALPPVPARLEFLLSRVDEAGVEIAQQVREAERHHNEHRHNSFTTRTRSTTTPSRATTSLFTASACLTGILKLGGASSPRGALLNTGTTSRRGGGFPSWDGGGSFDSDHSRSPSEEDGSRSPPSGSPSGTFSTRRGRSAAPDEQYDSDFAPLRSFDLQLRGSAGRTHED